MGTRSNEEVVRRYMTALEQHDGPTMAELRTLDWMVEMPQSGERVRGHANDRAIMANWPGGRPVAETRRLVGTEDRWVTTTSWTFQRVAGDGDVWWGDAVARYPDGSTWFASILLELRDGKVMRETWYFAPPLDPPEWRAQWVERFDPAEVGHRT